MNNKSNEKQRCDEVGEHPIESINKCSMFEITIDKEKVNEMPVLTYAGDIYVVDSPGQVNAAVATLRKQELVGFDTETRPSFRRGELHKTALIQLATEHECFLFRLNKIGIPAKLQSYLEDASCTKVGLSVHDDFHTMQRSYPLNPGGFIELQELVRSFQIAEMGLQKIYAILFGQKISKSQRLTNWEASTLSEAQQHYAAIDAWACINIYKKLRDGDFIPEQSPYYHKVVAEDIE